MSDDLVPIGSTEDEHKPESTATRRAFLGAAVVAGACYAGALGYPVYKYLASPVEMAANESAVTQVVLKEAHSLQAGAALMFQFGSSPALLIHGEDDSWVAFSAVCTHLGCTVEFQPQLKRIHCACHGGVYDPHTGKNISGPPPRPLTAYKVTVLPDSVVVSRT